METDYYVKELLIFVKSLIPIETVLLDRGFYTWGVIKVLKELKLYNPGSEIREVQGMVKERCGAARASGDTVQGEDKIRNKHVYCGIAGL